MGVSEPCLYSEISFPSLDRGLRIWSPLLSPSASWFLSLFFYDALCPSSFFTFIVYLLSDYCVPVTESPGFISAPNARGGLREPVAY